MKKELKYIEFIKIIMSLLILFSEGVLFAETITPFTWNGINFIGETSQGCSTCGYNGEPCPHHIGSFSTGALYSQCNIPGGGDGSCSCGFWMKTTNMDLRNMNEMDIYGTLTVSVTLVRDNRPAESHVVISITDESNGAALLSDDIALSNLGDTAVTVTHVFQDIHVWKRPGFNNYFFAQALNKDPVLMNTQLLNKNVPWNLYISASTSSGYRSGAYYNISIADIDIVYSKTNCACDVNGDGKCTSKDAYCSYQKANNICPTACGDCANICCDLTGEGQCSQDDYDCRLKESLNIHPNCFD